MAKSKTAKKITYGLLLAAGALVLGVATQAHDLVVAAASGSSAKQKYFTDYNTLDDAVAAAEVHAEREVAEGAQLLKNKDNALPLAGNAKVSVFGVSADALIGAAATSGQSTASAGGQTVAGVLKDQGFNVNPTLKAFYDQNSGSIRSEVTNFNGQIKGSFDLYNDAAIVVLARTGGEGSDCARVTSEEASTDINGKKDVDTHVALAQTDTTIGEGESATVKSTQYQHYLQLSKSERELLNLAKENFKKVVVVLNTSNAMEIQELKDCDGIDAVINIDRPGQGGLNALPKLLNGAVNPSGGLVDEWAADFTADPTWYNFGNNDQTGSARGGAGKNFYMSENGAETGVLEDGKDVIGDTEGFHGVDYEEGIYLGYKFYETYYADLYKKDPAAAKAWWEKHVTYPFGYGLSYTSFSFKSKGMFRDASLTNALPTTGLADLFKSTKAKAADIKKIYVPVEVTNTGSAAGKKTVQIYVEAPFTGKVERSSVALVGYAKTDILKPGQKQTVTVEVNVQDMAAWYSQAAHEGSDVKGAYIMEAGKYTLRIMENSHYDYATTKAGDTYQVDGKDVCYAEESFELDAEAVQEQDDFSGLEAKSLFTDGLNDNGAGAGADTKVGDSNFGNVRTAAMMADGTSGMTTLTRKAGGAAIAATVPGGTGTANGFDGSFPEAPKMADLTFKNSILDNWSFWDNYAVSNNYSGANDVSSRYKDYYKNDDNAGYVWSKTSVPSNWDQQIGTLKSDYENDGANGDKGTQKIWMRVSENNTIKFADMEGVPYDDPQWDNFLNQLTYDEMCSVNTYCGYGTGNIDSVNKDLTVDRDGPNSINQLHQMPAESLLSATWNVEIAEERGILIANIGLLGGSKGFDGWYAPGADTHRTPFSGRNNEYLSQDGFQGGVIGAALTQGVQSRGVICYTKHILMNDQETNRGCLFTWCDEQAMRENYMKCFQLILQEGGSKAGMTAYGRISGLSNTNNTNLSIELYQKEWGTQAYFVTDGYIGWNQRTNPDMMVRAGNQTILTTGNTEYLSGQTNPTNGTNPTGGFYKAGDTLPNGETAAATGLYLKQGESTYEISYTQWYCVRQMAHGVLFQVANSVGQRNGYLDVNPRGGQLTATEGISVENMSVSIDNMLDGDSFCYYTATGLPEGLSLDSSTGKISGTAEKAGTYNVTVTYRIDGWITRTANYTITVSTAIKSKNGSDDFKAAKVGQDFYAELDSDVYTSTEYNNRKFEITSGRLPAGVSLSENGTIEGKPTEAGTFEFTVKLTAKNDTAGKVLFGDKGGGGKGGSTDNSKTCETTFVMVVAGEAVIPQETKEIVSVTETADGYIITFSDGTTIEVKNGKDGKDGKDGQPGADGQPGTPGADGKDGVDGQPGKDGVDGKDGADGAGCGGSIIASSTILAGVAALGLAIAAKKKED